MCRFTNGSLGKVVLPLTFCEAGDGNRAWRWQAPPVPRSLYNLDGLARRPDAPVLIVEGEKAADAGAAVLPDYVVTTSPGGSHAADKADWSTLAGRKVIIWPDADDPGQVYAEAVYRLAITAGAASVAIVTLPDDVTTGWDLADAVAEGWPQAAITGLLAGATLSNDKTQDAKADNNRKRKPQRDLLVSLLEDVELWHDDDYIAYATIRVGAHLENWSVRSDTFKRRLTLDFYKASGGAAIGGQALEDTLRLIEARAVSEGARYTCWRRVARCRDRLYLDLCDQDWCAVEVDAGGWRAVSRPPVRFLRSKGMRALPEPEPGYLVEEMRRFVNVRGDDDFTLIAAWLVAALRERGPYPILIVNGEQGSGKSNLCRLLRDLIDPHGAPIRSVPREERDMQVSAAAEWVLAYDNLSAVPSWFADSLCRVATGGGFATRALHTNSDQVIFSAARPIILNGIPNLADRADLADRALAISLPTIDEGCRRPEDEFWVAWEQAKPRVLGALLDAVAAALRHLSTTKLERTPRMADFAKWATAAEPGLGVEAGTFLKAYETNRQDSAESAFDSDQVAVAVRDFVRSCGPDGFEGTASELLAALNDWASESLQRGRAWPSSAGGMGSRIKRVAPLLRRQGFTVEAGHTASRSSRYIRIVPAPDRAAS